MIPPLPVLDEDTARLARVYGKDRDSAGVLISRLMAHIDRQDAHGKDLSAQLNQAESHLLELRRQHALAHLAEQDRLSRQVSVCASPMPGVWSA